MSVRLRTSHTLKRLYLYIYPIDFKLVMALGRTQKLRDWQGKIMSIDRI